MTWQPARPSTEDKISEIPSILQGNWESIEDVLSVSHYGFGVATSGRHEPGQAGFLFTGSQTQINALSPTSGAIALASGTGLEHYDAGAWRDVGRRGWSRFRAYLGTSRAFTACQTSGTDSQAISFDQEVFDELGEYNTSTGTFTVCAGGPYLIVASLCLCANALCAATVTATPTSSEWYSENSSTCITATASPSADRVTDWEIVGSEATLWETLVDTTDAKAISGGTDGNVCVLGMASIIPSATLVKTLQGMTSADLATVVISARMRRSAGACSAQGVLQIYGTSFTTEEFQPTDVYSWERLEWPLNPRTSAAWTGAQIAGEAASGLSGFGFRVHTSTADKIFCSRAWLRVTYKLKNYSLVNDNSDSTYVLNSASPSVGGIDPMDIYKADSYSGVFPYTMAISGVKIKVRAAGGSKDFIKGTLMFPSHVTIPSDSFYTTDTCAIGYVARASQTTTFPAVTTYTDQTASANNATTNDVWIPINYLGSLGAIKYSIFGHTYKFNELAFNLSTVGASPPFTADWFYYTGTTWSSLTVVDATNDFTTTGTHSITFTPPADWNPTASLTGATGVGYYWLKAQVTAAVGSTTPCAAQVWVHPTLISNTSSRILCAVSDGATALNGSFSEYQTIWTQNPCQGSALTATAWTSTQVNASGTSAISGYGYNFSTATSGASVSEVRMYVFGYLLPHEVTMEIKRNGVDFRRVYNRWPVTGSEQDLTINFRDTVMLTAGDALRVELTKSTYNDVLSAGSAFTYFGASRISGRCF